MHATKQQRARMIPLKKRADFLYVQGKARKWVAKGFILQIAETPKTTISGSSDKIRIGFTVTKRTEKSAVKRNRIKRRLRAVAADTLSGHAMGGYDYILIGRSEALCLPYTTLCKDLRWCLRKLDVYQEA